MNKQSQRPIGFTGKLQEIRPKLVSNFLNRMNRMKGDGSSGGEGRGTRSNRYTGGRSCSCQTFVRGEVKEKGGKSLTCD